MCDYNEEYPSELACFPRVLVIAESYYLFRMSGLPQYHKYLARLPEDIRGLANCTLVLLGEYWKRKDWDDQILDYCNRHSIEVTRKSLTLRQNLDTLRRHHGRKTRSKGTY